MLVSGSRKIHEYFILGFNYMETLYIDFFTVVRLYDPTYQVTCYLYYIHILILTHLLYTNYFRIRNTKFAFASIMTKYTDERRKKILRVWFEHIHMHLLHLQPRESRDPRVLLMKFYYKADANASLENSLRFCCDKIKTKVFYVGFKS